MLLLTCCFLAVIVGGEATWHYLEYFLRQTEAKLYVRIYKVTQTGCSTRTKLYFVTLATAMKHS